MYIDIHTYKYLDVDIHTYKYLDLGEHTGAIYIIYVYVRIYIYIYIYIYISTNIPAFSPPAVPSEATPPDKFKLRPFKVFSAVGAVLEDCLSSQSIMEKSPNIKVDLKPLGTCDRSKGKAKEVMDWDDGGR
jgi:hypothetical protein